MYGNKANKLIILKKLGFKIPKFKLYNKYNIEKFDNIGNDLNFPMILRSSYSIEDGEKNAFAGIFESYFPIYNRKDYIKGLDICINVDKNNRFIEYIKINKVDIYKMKMNLILQEFIIGDFSGVCFTKNNNNELIIEIVPGINAPLVQGQVTTPFSIKIDRNNIKNYDIYNFYMDSTYKTIKNNKIIDKNFDLLQFEENILLNFKDRLVYQFLKIEKIFKYPQDIEFTVKGNDIYILQSRNVTTLVD